jgi:hypothetical protein
MNFVLLVIILLNSRPVYTLDSSSVFGIKLLFLYVLRAVLETG